MTKEKLLVALKEHKFLFSCLLCLFVSILAIKFGNISVVIYSLIVLASVFYLNITQTIALSGFGTFFYTFYGNGGLILPLIIAISLLAKIVFLLHKGQIYLDSKLLFPTIIIGFMTIHFFLVGFHFDQISRILELITCLVLLLEFYILRKFIDFKFLIRFFAHLLILSCFLALILSGMEGTPRTFFIDGRGIKRFYGYITHPNTLSVWCMGLIVLYTFLFFDKRLSFLETFLIVMFLTLFGLLSKSKTFIVVFALLFILYLIKSFHDNWRHAFAKLGFFVLVGICIFLLFNDFFTDSISRFFLYNKNDLFYSITTGRTRVWAKYLTKMKSSTFGMIFGLGGSSNINLDNSYLEVFVKYGIIGTLLVLSFIIFFFIDAKKNMRKEFYAFFPIVIVLANMLSSRFSASRFMIIIMCSFVLFRIENVQAKQKLILIYTPSLKFDTICNNILAITENLSQTFAFDILVNDLQRDETKLIEQQLVNNGVHIYYQKNDSSIKKYISLVRFLSKSRGKYQVAHINSIGQYDGFAAYLARAYGQIPKVIYHSYSGGTNDKNVIQDYIQLYLIKSYSTDFATCSIEAATKMYGPDFVKKCSSIKILDSFVDSSEYNYDRALREVARGRLNLANDYTILYVQDIYSGNYKKMINILLTTIYNYPNCRFVIVGDDQFIEMIKQKTKRYEIDENVCFVSSSLNINDTFNASDVLFAPSSIICQSSIVMLAKKSNLPIVASSNIVGGFGREDVSLPQASSCEEWVNAIMSMPSRDRKIQLSGIKSQNDKKTFASEMIQYYNM